MWRGASILHFKSNAPVSVDPSFSNIHDSGQYQQNGKRTYCWYCSVPSPSRIHLFIFLWTTKVFIFPNYFLIFYQTCTFHYGWGKMLNSWSSDYWKINSHVYNFIFSHSSHVNLLPWLLPSPSRQRKITLRELKKWAK